MISYFKELPSFRCTCSNTNKELLKVIKLENLLFSICIQFACGFNVYANETITDLSFDGNKPTESPSVKILNNIFSNRTTILRELAKNS